MQTLGLTQVGDFKFYRDQLWTAPELLRMTSRPLNGTQKADVYSFAIILQEIMFRASPYFIDLDNPQGMQHNWIYCISCYHLIHWIHCWQCYIITVSHVLFKLRQTINGKPHILYWLAWLSALQCPFQNYVLNIDSSFTSFVTFNLRSRSNNVNQDQDATWSESEVCSDLYRFCAGTMFYTLFFKYSFLNFSVRISCAQYYWAI